MRLQAHAQTLWLASMPTIEESPHRGLFAGRQLAGSAWLAAQPAEDRAIFAALGRRALALRGVNWHRLGGQARAAAPIRDRRGRFMAEPQW